ncbi:glutamate-tRNA ligase [Sphaceloma murrayae]|uniref:glutamate--tRNA ligase n=1 Tax=Sphaceloma murrayae TaxID=2082308 RepID=A0A2K1R1U1_9PEZI|nr:glutamate-tRNA ligase [Sphaceloma murrayae]
MAGPLIKEWQDRAEALKPLNLKQIEGPLAELDSHLTLRTYIVGYEPTEADLTVWKTLRGNRIAHSYIKQNLMLNLCRWFRFIEETLNPEVQSTRPKAADEGGNYEIGLHNTEAGVVTRFPPEPSGYLHIGHAKAALLNDYFAHKKYQGKLILRFDDTNPLKEKQEFEDSIIYDLELMGIKPDQLTHTSDYFQELYDWCVDIIKAGKAYADNTPQEQLREERLARIESRHRNASVEDSLAHFEEMKSGSTDGQKWYIRAKIDMSDNNGAMRDPVIYRCSPEKHHRTGDKWKIYPTYDFACPLIDAHEGVTHALRTTEYNDRDAQYQWFLKALGLRHVYNWNFARMSFIRTFLSKRKLTKVVESGLVWGWDDPRFPTVRGIRRRGMTVPALQEFIVKQGPSKAITLMDWTSIWATNKKFIDPVAGRYTAIEVEGALTCKVSGEGVPAGPKSEERDLHAKNKDVGKKTVWFSDRVLLDQADAQSFDEGEEITLMNWGNAFVRNIQKGPDGKVSGLDVELHLKGDVKTTKKKITWLSPDQELQDVWLYDFDYLLMKDKLEDDDDFDAFLNKNTEKKVKCLTDVNVKGLKEDDIIQFDRKGFFRCDKPVGGSGRSRIGGVDGRVTEEIGKAGVFFQIPTGKGGK